MKWKPVCLIALACFLACVLPAKAEAQTTTATLSWAQSEPLATVQTFVYTYKVDSGIAVAVTPACVAAVAPATGTTCSTPFVPTPPLGPGVHVISVTATNGIGSATGILNGAAPTVPTQIKIIFTVTVP